MTRYHNILSQKTAKFAAIAIVGTVVGLGMAHTANAQPTTPQTVARVDLDRYMGTWYEIARLPMFFQRHCASDVTASYSQNQTVLSRWTTNVSKKTAKSSKALVRQPKTVKAPVGLK